MINLNSDFLDSEVFPFLQKSFQSLYPVHGGERRIFPSGLMREGVVRIETPIGIPLIGYTERVIEIMELSSLETGQPLTYFYLRGFRREPKSPIERTSSISVHHASKNAPSGRFSGPVLIQDPHQNPEQHSNKVAMVLTSVLRDLGRVLKCEPPEIHPDSIKRFAFCVNSSE